MQLKSLMLAGLLFLSFNCGIYAQSDFEYFNTFEIQLGWQRSGFIDLGWNGRWDIDPPKTTGFIKIHIPGSQHSVNANLGLSHGFQLKETALQIRTGYDFYWAFSKEREAPMFFLGGVQTQLISDFRNIDFRVMPELGLHLFGVIYLKYGYAIPLLEYRFEHLSPHRLAVGLSIPII